MRFTLLSSFSAASWLPSRFSPFELTSLHVMINIYDEGTRQNRRLNTHSRNAAQKATSYPIKAKLSRLGDYKP